MAKASAARNERQADSPIIIINTTAGPFHVPYGPKTGPEAHSPCATYTLWPGLNEPVEPDVWRQIYENPVLREWEQQELIEIVDTPPVELRKRDAEALIERSAGIDAMKWWRSIEKNGEVCKLLDKKIADMSKRIPKDEDEDEDDI